MALIHQKIGEYTWIKYIKYRISKNKNFIAGTYGPTGSGKSYVDLSIAEMLNPDFHKHPERICYSPLQLIKLINGGNVKRGDVIILEELGIQAGNRDWQSMFNRVILQLIQTFRRMGFILLVNVPYEDFIDKGVRKLVHASFRTKTINYNKNICKIKPQLVQYNDRIPKFYYKYLRIKVGNKIVRIKEWNIPLPSQKLTNIYEKQRNMFTMHLNKELERKLNVAEQKENDIDKLDDIDQQIHDNWEKGVKPQEISEIVGINVANVYRRVKKLRKKGFKLSKFKQKPPISLENSHIS
jgi:hypothetical protein